MTSRLGPGLKIVLVTIAGVGLLQALLQHWLGMVALERALVCIPDLVWSGQVWRLLTAGVLTDITHPMELIFTLLMLYFLSPDLERQWGTWRFLGFLALCIVSGNLLAMGVDRLAPESLALLHPPVLMGPGAAMVGTAIAWGLANRSQQILFFMVLPMSGMALVWLTVATCFLYLLYMGDVAGFGGVVAGFTMVGEASLFRRAYLHLKLALLRRRTGGRVPTARDILAAKQPLLKKPRGDRPPLRVVQGGQADEDTGKREPKDKRYLN
jgi:membrane associated rhomboid family serine protease